MRILSQNRECIFDDRESCIELHGKTVEIWNTSLSVDDLDDFYCTLGIYSTKEQAKDVLKEIFDCKRDTYTMPENVGVDYEHDS